MTIKELYIWAMKNNRINGLELENLPIGFEHRDLGGAYSYDTYKNERDEYEIKCDVETTSDGEPYVLLYCSLIKKQK